MKKAAHYANKSLLHPRSKHTAPYNFKQLIESNRELQNYVKLTEHHNLSIDFFDPKAVKALNKALLKYFYNVNFWDIPPHYLCPPIPGRADYIHYLADLLGNCNNNTIPTGKFIKCLDIGVGANCIYPLIGVSEYHWSFIGSEVDPAALNSATHILNQNSVFKKSIEVRLQKKSTDYFRGILKNNEMIDLTLCNPPFYASAHEAQSASLRKLNNLKGTAQKGVILNFGGLSHELWCKGGEKEFIRNMIYQSVDYASNCLWFTTLVSQKDSLPLIYAALKQVNVASYHTVIMRQGNKISRLVAWSFLSTELQQQWVKARWHTQT